MQDVSLRQAARARGFDVGAAVAVGPLREEPQYRQTLATQFGMLTAENVMKFGPIHPEQRRFDFAPADALVAFAGEHGMQVRGHTLVWHQQLAPWLAQGSWRPHAWRDHLQAHIDTVVGRYRGRVACWDVVNEAVADDGSLRHTVWLQHVGPDYLDLAFHLAHAADPAARLFYNDYGGEGLGPKSDAVFALVRGMLQRGVPVHGVGLQMHVAVSSAPPPEQLAANMARLASLGLEVHVTEMDVRLPEPFEESDLHGQARVYAGVLRVCLEAPTCRALVLWGFTDRHSWVPAFFRGWGRALAFDEQYRPKPAHAALLAVLVQADGEGARARPPQRP